MVLAMTMAILGMFMSKVVIPLHIKTKEQLIQQLAQKRSSTIVIELNDKKNLEKTIDDMKIKGYRLSSAYVETNNELELTFSRVAD